MEELLKHLRSNGWRVAVHNDYQQDGQTRTFWLLTHACGIWVKGEAATDVEALLQCEIQARKAFAPSPRGSGALTSPLAFG